jgi:hypothetical protein
MSKMQQVIREARKRTATCADIRRKHPDQRADYDEPGMGAWWLVFDLLCALEAGYVQHKPDCELRNAAAWEAHGDGRCEC